ncbi:S8 family serine peptidase [Mesorhizobium sp. M0491]|uniref:S8 family serine peptidase n=1 Tax=unclassified Mesorhizobium TaxID=325217 RepID=UPI00333D9F77
MAARKISRTTIGKAKIVVRRVRTWPTPKVLSFGVGLEPIVKTSKPLAERIARLAEEVPFSVATSTKSGEPIQAQIGLLTSGNIDAFRPLPEERERALEKLEAVGCTVVRRGRFSVSMRGPAHVVQEIIGQKLVVQASPQQSPLRSTRMFAESFWKPSPQDLFLAPEKSLSVSSKVADGVDHLVFIPPPLFFAQPSAKAPNAKFHSLNEAAIRKLLNVPKGVSGAGVRVAVVDTGFFPHPYYTKNKLALTPVKTNSAPRPHIDVEGHGTAITYNVFAVAPGAEVLGFQHTDPPQDAIEDAADQGADIISCSWGYDREQVFPILQASLLDVIAEGKIVLFASGNGHYAWPGSEPDVISVGGVYSDENFGLEASNYASGYMSGMFLNRRVPDVAGLCGQTPRAIYIMMPTQPANEMDRDLGGADYPAGDGTLPDDGWVGASGTSSATPQIAGVVALMLERAKAKGRTLSPSEVKAMLTGSCTPISQGRNAMGFPAVGQPNNAVGYGLVDAAKALAQV